MKEQYPKLKDDDFSDFEGRNYTKDVETFVLTPII
jgi:hypothetical protein